MVSHQSPKDEVKRIADAVELIGQFVRLRKAGRNYVGLCPFHSEKDPSFTVNPERQTFHCFGCNKGGDIFDFWMEYHGSTFKEALQDLAERYRVTLAEGHSPSEEKRKARIRRALFDINEKAAAYFEGILNRSGLGAPGRDYLAGRSLSGEVAADFRLGYAPNEWQGLTDFLGKQGLAMEAAVQAGLIIPRKSSGYYDRFRGRIIFPIVDLRGRVVGFGGRVLDDALPKYLNTPETPIFRKGELLYGIHAAHKVIREKKRAVIVEGYMDCLALKGHGLDEVVATLGTSLTERHVRKVKGYAEEAVVVFDSDEAGREAALKSLAVFLNEGLTAKVAVLPDGHDPDSYVNGNGLEKLQVLLRNAPAMFDFFLEQKLMVKEPDIEGRVRAMNEVVPVLACLRSDTRKALYVQRVAERLGLKEEVVLAEMRKQARNPGPGSWGNEHRQNEGLPSAGAGNIGEMQLLNLLIYYPGTIQRLMESECSILVSDPVTKKIVKTVFEKYQREGDFQPENLFDDLEGETACKERLRGFMHRPFSVYSGEEVEAAVEDFERQAERLRLSESIRHSRGDAAALNRVLERKKLEESRRGRH